MNNLSPKDIAAKEAAKKIKDLREAGNFKGSIELGEQYLKELGEHPRILCSIGDTYKRKKDYQEARTYYERAHKLDKQDPVPLHAIGYTYIAEKNSELAKQYFHAALELSPNDPISLRCVGQMALQENNPEEAYGYLKRAAEEENYNEKTLASLSVSCLQIAARTKEKYDEYMKEAEKNAKKLALINKQNCLALAILSLISLSRNNPQQAKNYCSQCLSASPYNEAGHMIAARIYIHEGKYQEAANELYNNFKNKFHPPSIEILKAIAERGVGIDEYRKILETAFAKKSIRLNTFERLSIDRPSPVVNIDAIADKEILSELAYETAIFHLPHNGQGKDISR